MITKTEEPDWPKVSHTGQGPLALTDLSDPLLRGINKADWVECPSGVPVILHYEDGELISGVTLSGDYGLNITPNLVMVRGLPRKLPHSASCSVQGHVILLDELRSHFGPGCPLRTHLLAKDRDRAAASQYFTFKAEDVYSTTLEFKDYRERAFYLRHNLNFGMVNHGFDYTADEFSKLHEAYLDELKEDSPYGILGLVFKPFKRSQRPLLVQFQEDDP